MPFHCCPDEVLMFMAMFPFIGYFFAKVHAWWHIRFKHKCHHKIECQERHLDHHDYNSKMTYVSEEDMNYLRGNPVPLHRTFQVEIEENKK